MKRFVSIFFFQKNKDVCKCYSILLRIKTDKIPAQPPLSLCIMYHDSESQDPSQMLSQTEEGLATQLYGRSEDGHQSMGYSLFKNTGVSLTNP